MKCFGCLIVLLFFLFQNVDMQYYQCLNPQNVYGYCVPLNYCGYIVNVIQYYPQNNEAQNFVRKSYCGYNKEKQEQYVCCLQYQITNAPQAQNRNFNAAQPKGTTQQNGSAANQPINSKTDISSTKLMKCGFDIDNRIFGGTKSNINDFTWLALLRYAKTGSSTPNYRCAGSLINNRFILTAAHCVHPRFLQNTKLISARLGEYNLSTDEDCQTVNGRQVCSPTVIDVPVEDVIIHETYLPQSQNQHNDIALVKLGRKVQFSEFVKPICLQQDKSITITQLLGQSLVVAGFGQTENYQNSNVKLQVSISVVDNEQCNKVFRSEGRRLGDGQICAGGVFNQDSCKGDSGGPLMKLVNSNGQIYWVLYGIVSYGSTPCGLKGNAAVYTKVDQYIEWIESKLKA